MLRSGSALWVACASALALAIAAGVADWRRHRRRRSIDSVGWVPWRDIQLTAFFAALAFAILALN